MNAVVSWDANGSPIEAVDDLPHAQKIAWIGHRLAELPQTPMPLTHRFAPGIYLREIFMPANMIVIGMIHKTEHFNVLLKGCCDIVHADGSRERLTAPMTFVSGAGVQKVLHILEDTVWQTIHLNPAESRDIDQLEHDLVEPVPADPSELLT